MFKKVLIAGASGFIGQALVQELLKDESLSIIALSRSDRKSTHPRLEWKKCDLFSLKETRSAIEGCTHAYYLVHSMLPTAGLSQGEFYDFDLLLADNFMRGIKKAKTKRLIYLGGLIPADRLNLSWHLKSRLEVEETLKNSDAEFVMLRAGLIIGKNGSSFFILKRLIERLPVMILPSWTKTKMEPIALEDVIRILVRSLHDASLTHKVFDIGGHEKLSYQELILKTAKVMAKHPITISFNLVPLGLSRFWVRLITRAPKSLVYPLVLSLKHTMLVDAKRAWPYQEDIQTSINGAIRSAIENISQVQSPGAPPSGDKNVRSVQRLPLPNGKSAEWASQEYFSWLPNFFKPLVQVVRDGNRLTFKALNLTVLILEKNDDLSSSDRQLLYIRGGRLATNNQKGRLEFREVLGSKYLIAGIHDYVPTLPWKIYKLTQAKIHLRVMRAFGKHLSQL